MTLDGNQTASLLGTQKATRPNVYDLVTGNNRQDVTTASLRGLLSGEPQANLTENQKSSLSQLESYITENVSGDDQTKLLDSLAGLQQLLELGNTDQANLDPIFSLLATADTGLNLNSLLKTGSVFDSLA
jgi:hypothetical protein